MIKGIDLHQETSGVDSLSPYDEARELLDKVNELFESLKTSAIKQFTVKKSIAECYDTERYRRTVDNVTIYVTNLPRFVEESCTRFHALSSERLKIISIISEKIELQTILRQINCLLISSLYWLRSYVRETISILPYLIDVSLGLQDIHNLVSAIDAVEKLVSSGALKQLFVSVTMASVFADTCNMTVNSVGKRLPVCGISLSVSAIYTMLMDPSDSLTLSKALNVFADIRAQISSNRLMTSLQKVLFPVFDSGIPSFGDNDVNMAPKFDHCLVAQRFQTDCLNLIEDEVKIARSLIDCFSKSTGFVDALSRKTIRKSISMDLIDSGTAEVSVFKENEFEGAASRPLTASKSRRPKSVIWVDTVDQGIRSRLENAYSKWFFGRLKTALIGRCLFSVKHPKELSSVRQNSTRPWSLNWEQMRLSCDFLLKVLNHDSIHGPPRELLSLVLTSALLRSHEFQNFAVIDEISNFMLEDKLLLLERENERALGCQTEIGAQLFIAGTEIGQAGPYFLESIPQHLYDQLCRIQLSTVRSLLDFCETFFAKRGSTVLAKKSFNSFFIILNDAEVVLPHYRKIVNKVSDLAIEAKASEMSSIDSLLSIILRIESSVNKQRETFLGRLADDAISYLDGGMPNTQQIWRSKKPMGLQPKSKLKTTPENETSYAQFSVQPNSYALGLYRSCLCSHLTILLASIFSTTTSSLLWPTPKATFACQLLFDCVTAVFMAWLKFLLEKRIKFSSAGARQLEADFQSFQSLIEQQFTSFTKNSDSAAYEERSSLLLREFRSLPITHQLRSIVYILLAKTADFNLSAISRDTSESSMATFRSHSADSDPSLVEAGPIVTPRRRQRRRKRGGVAPLSSADSDKMSPNQQKYPIPFGAEAWLQLIDDWPNSTGSNSLTGQHHSRIFGISSDRVNIVCHTGCMPRRFWRRGTSPTNV